VSGRIRVALLAVALGAAIAPAAQAAPGTIAVGIAGASPEEVAAAVEARTGGRLVEDLGPLDALLFAVPDAAAAEDAVAGLPGVAYAERLRPGTRRLAFVPDDPLFAQQWHLASIRAFDHWLAPPVQPPVRVAVIDSGVDGGHPELAGRIAAARSFVGGSALSDSIGHGTIVAGEIAAALNNATGIAGASPSAQLLVAKVVAPNGSISIANEARAIRWAVAHGASVINLSIGGPRNPRRPALDTYSALEHDAVDYATRKGVVVVAAAGNCGTPACPERYANWPAALPHVIGVGAIAPGNTVPSFSNRDARHVDLAAPGTDIVSLLPRALTPGCDPQGYTVCFSGLPEGTSFSTPLVVAAAAVLRAERGMLGGRQLDVGQVRGVLTRSAADIFLPGHDPATGHGRLDVTAALESLATPLPPRDTKEPNDDVRARAATLPRALRATWASVARREDVRDVYRLYLLRGERLDVRLVGPPGSNLDLALWRPETRTIGARRADRLAFAVRPGRNERLVRRAERTGWHFLEVRLAGGEGGRYSLRLARTR
jgi:subtilisin family serine protease